MKTHRWSAGLALVCAMAFAVAAGPALAQKSGGSGGSSSGGGGGTGGASTSLTTSTIKLLSWNMTINGVIPAGRATFGYDKTGTARSFSITVTNVNMPDGSQLLLNIQENLGPAQGYAVNLESFYIPVMGGTATWSVSTANGDYVPNFPLPSMGETDVYVLAPVTWGTFQTVLSGWFGSIPSH